jgi:hypothetical protein
VLACALSAPLVAGSTPRVRVSRDLELFLSRGGPGTARIIAHGTSGDLRDIAARHGATIRRFLADGAVLEVTRAQLAALTAENVLDHLSGELRRAHLRPALPEAHNPRGRDLDPARAPRHDVRSRGRRSLHRPSAPRAMGGT